MGQARSSLAAGKLLLEQRQSANGLLRKLREGLENIQPVPN